jgi:hypothetical protein
MATWVTGPFAKEAFALGETPEAAVHNLTGCTVNQDEGESTGLSPRA